MNSTLMIKINKTGNRNEERVPITTALPKSMTAIARYTGFLLNRNGPDVIRTAGDSYGESVVRFCRNRDRHRNARNTPAPMIRIPDPVKGAWRTTRTGMTKWDRMDRRSMRRKYP